jgi:hypothetical protein
MGRINIKEAIVITVAMLGSFFFGVFRESMLFYDFTTWQRYAGGLLVASILVIIAGVVVSIFIERGCFIDSEEKEWVAVSGRTTQERATELKDNPKEEPIFSDPEIEAMFNRGQYFVIRNEESPKGPLDEEG